HKDSTEELPEWAWVEYQVIHDNHATTTKAPRSFRKIPGIFEMAQWRNARHTKNCDRNIFPASGALGELITPKIPSPAPTMPDPSPLPPLAEIPIGAPEINEEMGEDETPAWPTAEKLTRPDEYDEHQVQPDSPDPPGPPETAIELTAPESSNPTPTPDPTPETTPTASTSFNNDLNYMPGLEGESPVPVHYLAWLIRNTITPIMSRLEQADAAIITLHDTVEKQTRAINSLTTTLQELRKASYSKTNNTPSPPNDKNKNNTTPNANDKGKNPEKKKNDSETANNTPKKTYANAAATNNHQDQGSFTKVLYKKKAPAPFFTPEYTRLNRQVIVETNGPIPDLISNDDILEIVNEATSAQGLKFLSAQRSLNGNLRFETNPSTSADEGAKYHVEITLALDKLHIQATNIYANSRWSKFVIHGVPAYIGTKNSVELSARIADEIFAATNFSLAQPPRWLTSPEVLQNRGNGQSSYRSRGKLRTSDSGTTRKLAQAQRNAASAPKLTRHQRTPAKSLDAQQASNAPTPTSVAPTAPQA
ncbi:hypothetical protein Q9L58_010538, partial [Maublancomyces gigas]